MGKIQNGKFSIVNLCRFIICLSCFLGIIESAKINLFPFELKFGLPFLSLLIPPHSFESASVIWLLFSIHGVLAVAAFAKIGLSVIQGVMIFVVSLFSTKTSDYVSVHKNVRPLLVTSTRIKNNFPRFWNFLGNPIPLREYFKIFCIYDCILSFSERDKAVRCIKRLSHCVSFHAVFHRASFKGSVQLSRYFIIGGT